MSKQDTWRNLKSPTGQTCLNCHQIARTSPNSFKCGLDQSMTNSIMRKCNRSLSPYLDRTSTETYWKWDGISE